MNYRVIYASSFRDDLGQQVEYLLSQGVSVATINHWFAELYEVSDSLEDLPRRFPVDPVQTGELGQETRKAVVGDYLVFYQVNEDHKQVDVVAFRHGAKHR